MKVLTRDSDLTRQDALAAVIKTLLMGKLYECEFSIEVGEFDNCRESGHTYRAISGRQDFTFCVYEHRNSDQIIINGCDTDKVKSYGPYGGDDKYYALARFSYHEYEKCADTLYAYLKRAHAGIFSATNTN